MVLPVYGIQSSRKARWYDKNPQLAFAFHMLSLTPRSLQSQVLANIRDYLQLQWSLKPKASLTQLPRRPDRWYDFSEETTDLLELIKGCPVTIQSASAVRMIAEIQNAA